MALGSMFNLEITFQLHERTPFAFRIDFYVKTITLFAFKGAPRTRRTHILLLAVCTQK